MSEYTKEDKDALSSIVCFLLDRSRQLKRQIDLCETSNSDRLLYEDVIDGLVDLSDYLKSSDGTYLSSFLAKSKISKELSISLIYDEYDLLMRQDKEALTRKLYTLVSYIKRRIFVMEILFEEILED
jgi:hypothetical protein